MKNFVVYKSGAGSGKTFTLVKEYLRLALYDKTKLTQNYRRILAITFTNKAAAEMKSRVVSALDQVANNPVLSTTGEILCKELGISPDELRKRAKVVLTHLLHHYSDFAIGTIDSFTHKIVKTFAQELDLPVNFNVELDAPTFYEKVIAQLISKVGEDEQVSRLLKEYVLSRAEDNSFWDPESSMQEFAGLLMKEDAGAYLQQLSKFSSQDLEEFHVQFIDFIRHYKNTLREGGQKALELISKAGLSDDDFTYKKSGPQNFFKKCRSGEAGLEEARGSRIQAAVTQDKWAGNGSNERSIRSIIPQLNSIAGSLINFIEQNYEHFSLCETLSKQMYALMLLRKIEEITKQQKQEERIVFISEFNDKIHNLISEEPTPFIYERLGERYQHFLLDEFQDTSSLQWQNLLPLLDNALGGGWYNLVVGDGKQSIYRWRNANVRQFASLPALPEGFGGALNLERAESLKRNYLAKVLDTNYRSSATIVNFNNTLFESLRNLVDTPNGLPAIYEQHAQKTNDASEGYITVTTGLLPAEDVEETNYRATLQHIKTAIEDGFVYSDVCVLCRSNLHGNNIAAFLVENKIPVVSSDSLLLKNNLEVNTILAYLRTLVNPRDQVSAAAVVTYVNLSDDIDESTYERSLKQVSSGEPLNRVLSGMGIRLQSGDRLYNLSDHCLNVITALRMERGAHQYIRFFLDEVNEYLVMHSPGISGFLEWWESRKNKASLIIPPSTDAVKIMTIHASKGLEFPVVIIPFCNWAIYRPTQSWVKVNDSKVSLPVSVVKLSRKAAESGFSEELEREQGEQVLDNLNLLYVALTRAANRLHLICQQSKGQNAETVATWISARIPEAAKQEKEGFYVAGRRNKRGERKSKPENIFSLERLNFDHNEDVVRVKPSLPSGGEKRNEALSHGTMIHALLAGINNAENVEDAINKGLEEGWFTEDEKKALGERVKQIITRDELREWFSPGIDAINERELITSTGELLRPDKVVINGNEAVIIDYKTGAEQLNRHTQQMRGYALALEEMGYKKIKKLLVYLDTDRVVEVN